MIKIFLFITGLTLCAQLFSQKIEIYDPTADAEKQIAEAVTKAHSEGKHVFLQIGGNWCPWCIKFHRFVDSDQEIKQQIENNFIVERINYSQENRNQKILAELGFPQRFGFPVFVILDGKGRRIHTQNSAYLEEGESYSEKEVLQFLKHWSPKALDPDSYKPKEK